MGKEVDGRDGRGEGVVGRSQVSGWGESWGRWEGERTS